MSMTFDQLLEEVRKLPVGDQERLRDVIDADLSDGELSPAWKAEIAKRLADMEANPNDTISSEEMWASVETRFGLRFDK